MQKKESSVVGPVVLGLFVFVVIGSGLFLSSLLFCTFSASLIFLYDSYAPFTLSSLTIILVYYILYDIIPLLTTLFLPY